MKIKLNYPPDKYSPCYGNIFDGIKNTIDNDRKIASVSDIMRCRLNFGDDLYDWLKHNYGTSDFVVFHPDNKLKISTDKNIFSDHNIVDNINIIKEGFQLPEELYDSISGLEYRTGYMQKRYYNEKNTYVLFEPTDVKNDPVLGYLSDNFHLLDDYVDFTVSKSKEYNTIEKIMGIDILENKISSRDSILINFMGIGDMMCNSPLFLANPFHPIHYVSIKN